MSPPKPTDSRRLYQQIADQIKELIAQGSFQVGDRLPAERELALLLGVSRPSVREGLIALDVQGNVEIRGGSGVYVCPQPELPATKATPELGESPRELMQARREVARINREVASLRNLPLDEADLASPGIKS